MEPSITRTSELKTLKLQLQAALEGQRSSELQKNRMNAGLDLQVLDCDEVNSSWADYTYEKKEEHLNPYDGIHGGVICALADTCAGVTIAVVSGRMPSTTELSCSYLRPMNGTSYRIHVELNQLGNQLAGSTCSIVDLTTGKLCATCMLRYVLLNRPVDL